MDSTPKISKVYKFGNGMVMVFDQYGEQMPEYQGTFEEKRELILANADDEVEYLGGSWGTSHSLVELTKEDL